MSDEAVAWLRQQIEADLNRWTGQSSLTYARDRVADCEAKLAILDVHAVRSHYCPLPSLASTHGQLWTPDEGRCWTLHLLASAYQHRRGHAEHWPAPVSS